MLLTGLGVAALSTRLSLMLGVSLGLLLLIGAFLVVKKIYLNHFFLLLVFTCFLGSAIEIFKAGPVTFFPFRIVLFVYWFVLLLFFITRPGVDLQVKCVRNYLVFLGFWLFFAAASFAWMLDVDAGIKNLLFLSGGITLIFALIIMDKEYAIKKTIQIWLWVLTGFVLFAYLERLFAIHLPVSGANTYPYAYMRYWPTVVFRNPNDLATFFSISFPLALMLLFAGKTMLQRMWGLFLAGSSAYMIFFVSSRANILAIVLEFAVLFVLLRLKNSLKMVAGAGVVLLIVALLFSQFMPSVVGRMIEPLNSLKQQYQTQSGSVLVRQNLIKNGLYFLSKQPLLGIGAGNIEYYLVNKSVYDVHGIQAMHNWWFEVLVNYGVIIFTMFLIFFASLLWNMYRLAWHNQDWKYKAIAMSLTGFTIASISSSSIMTFNFVWCLYGLALTMIAADRLKKMRDQDECASAIPYVPEPGQ